MNYLRKLPFNEVIYFSDVIIGCNSKVMFEKLFQIIDENWMYQEFNIELTECGGGFIKKFEMRPNVMVNRTEPSSFLF